MSMGIFMEYFACGVLQVAAEPVRADDFLFAGVANKP
jgi:hypothetical protein